MNQKKKVEQQYRKLLYSEVEEKLKILARLSVKRLYKMSETKVLFVQGFKETEFSNII